jgi:hypothetical protein
VAPARSAPVFDSCAPSSGDHLTSGHADSAVLSSHPCATHRTARRGGGPGRNPAWICVLSPWVRGAAQYSPRNHPRRLQGVRAGQFAALPRVMHGCEQFQHLAARATPALPEFTLPRGTAPNASAPRAQAPGMPGQWARAFGVELRAYLVVRALAAQTRIVARGSEHHAWARPAIPRRATKICRSDRCRARTATSTSRSASLEST